MTKRQDWLPQNHHSFESHVREALNHLNGGGTDGKLNCERMGFVEDSKQAEWLNKEFQAKYNAFAAAFVTWQNPATRTAPVSVEFRQTEAALKKVYRQLYGILKNLPGVTDSDLSKMNMPARRDPKSRTSAPVPTTFPMCEVDTSTLRRLKIHFQDAGSETKAKPKGVHGCELCWVLLDQQPDTEAELIHSDFKTRTPFTLKFTEVERGKMVYFALRWVNTRGEKGPFGEIQCARVP